MRASNKSTVDVKIMNYFYLWIDNKPNKSINRVLLKHVVSIKAVRNKFILYTKCIIEYKYSEFDFLKKSFMKISGKATLHLLKGPCGIPVEKRSDILNNLTQVITQNRKRF